MPLGGSTSTNLYPWLPQEQELGRSVTLITTAGLWLFQALFLLRREVLGVVFEGKAPQHYVDTGEEGQRAE